jgi:hypothetical protein
MLEKFHLDARNGRIGEWFDRYKVDIIPDDIARFRRETLDPILEQLVDWWEFMSTCHVTNCSDIWKAFNGHGMSMVHWRHPLGVYNILDEGGSTDLDNYLETGSEVGLHRDDKLFKELEE